MCMLLEENMDKIEAWSKLKFDVMFVGDWYSTEKWNTIESQLHNKGVKLYIFHIQKTLRTLINKLF